MFFLILYFLTFLKSSHEFNFIVYAAHFLEFSRENTKKLEDYMTEWRAKARREKDSALRKHNTFKASKRARG